MTLDVTALGDIVNRCNTASNCAGGLLRKPALSVNCPGSCQLLAAEGEAGSFERFFRLTLRGDIAHFRRPDTTVTHATYPFITRTVLAGLCASIIERICWMVTTTLGFNFSQEKKTFHNKCQCSVRDGWGSSNDTFNRQTSVELVVEPHYRVYYVGPHMDDLFEMISTGRSIYHTYLGSAYCLTLPFDARVRELEEIRPSPGTIMKSVTVVPTHAIQELIFADSAEYGRVGGGAV